MPLFTAETALTKTAARKPAYRFGAGYAPVVLAFIVAFGVVPLVASDYWLSSIIIPTIVMGLAGIGLNLLMGFTGLVSLGSAAFMSIGAFSAYNLLLRVPV